MAGGEVPCAVCGMKLLISTGVSVIDAAHILPFSKFKNDNLRNGIALCKTRHWLFDRGIISMDERYRIMVSPTVETEVPENVLSSYHRSHMFLPKERAAHPALIALKRHRENVFRI